ncbi:MAG: hypothetical protein WAN89_06380 [Lawsonella sp.]
MRFAPLKDSEEKKERRPGQRPQDVETSILLWIIVAVLSVLQQILTTVQIARHPDRIEKYVKAVLTAGAEDEGRSLEEQFGVDAPAQIEMYARITPWIMLVFGLLIVAFMCFMVYKMSQQKRWARMVLNFGGAYLTVSAIFTVFGVMSGNGANQDPLRMLFTPGAIDGGSILDFINISLIVLQGIVAVPGVYGMFKKDSNEWFMEGLVPRRKAKKKDD